MPKHFGDQGVWVKDEGDYYVNSMNPKVSKDWENHRFSVPGIGGASANPNSAVTPWEEGSLVESHAP